VAIDPRGWGCGPGGGTLSGGPGAELRSAAGPLGELPTGTVSGVPSSYVISLVVVVVAVMTSRVLLAARVRASSSRRASRPDAVLVLLGWLGLTFHCGAMFYRSAVESIPGIGSLVETVNAMSTASVVAFTVPAALLLIGLRRARPLLIGSVFAALAAVGVTMYNGGSLDAHLTGVFVAIVLIAFTTAELLAAGRTETPNQRSGPPKLNLAAVESRGRRLPDWAAQADGTAGVSFVH